jgi:hypothetical protein
LGVAWRGAVAIGVRVVEGLGMRVSPTAEVKTRRAITMFISDHPSSPVNFPRFLVPRKFRKFGKFAFYRPSSPP